MMRPVANFTVKNLSEPDEVIRTPGANADLVTLGDMTVGREVDAPGWRWSTHMRPLVGGDWCEAHHLGVQLSGRAGYLLRDGTEFEVGPNDVFEILPGHDSWTIGEEPVVCLEWSGLRTWVGSAGTFGDRVLTTLLMTDVVDSTGRLADMGDTAWREMLARFFGSGRELIATYRGRLVDTTGDGVFALFDTPGLALRCASSLRQSAQGLGLAVRAGINTGEVELAGASVRGLAVHEVARVMAAAAPDEILVTDMTRSLAVLAGAQFDGRGDHVLKGLDGPRSLFAYTGMGAEV
jgi:class 3 adenylate cyclase